MPNFKKLAEARRRSFVAGKPTEKAEKNPKNFNRISTIDVLESNVMKVPQNKNVANVSANLVDESTGFAVIDPAHREAMRTDSIVSATQFQSLPRQDESGMFMNRGSIYRAESFISGAPEYADR